jgi:hypothetical protein
MSRPKHPNKAIEAAIQYAEFQGWHYSHAGNSSHAWGRLWCRKTGRSGCRMSIWSTPKVPENHAKQIRRQVDKCPHDKDT